MRDISKLPKWAQKRIEEAEAAQVPVNKYGAYVAGCHIENNAVRHDEHSAKAIASVADAIGRNADALKELSKSLSGTGVEVEFGNGLHFQDVKVDSGE